MADRRDATLEAMRLAAALDERLHALCAAWQEGDCAAVWTFSELAAFTAMLARARQPAACTRASSGWALSDAKTVSTYFNFQPFFLSLEFE